jgi:hypothetical protein
VPCASVCCRLMSRDLCRTYLCRRAHFWRHNCQFGKDVRGRRPEVGGRRSDSIRSSDWPSVGAARSLSADGRPQTPRNLAVLVSFQGAFGAKDRRRPRGRPGCSTLQRALGFVCISLDAREVESRRESAKNCRNIWAILGRCPVARVIIVNSAKALHLRSDLHLKSVSRTYSR